MSSAICFNLDQSKILLSGNGLNITFGKCLLFVKNLDFSLFLQLVFEGIRGNGIRSDIAIDDVKITNGACSGSQGSCDFEKNTCLWTNTRYGDNFDWLRKSGSTSSTSTGPNIDHTIGTFLGKIE